MKFCYCNISKTSSYCVLEDVSRLSVFVLNIYLWPFITRFCNSSLNRDISVQYSLPLSQF